MLLYWTATVDGERTKDIEINSTELPPGWQIHWVIFHRCHSPKIWLRRTACYILGYFLNHWLRQQKKLDYFSPALKYDIHRKPEHTSQN